MEFPRWNFVYLAKTSFTLISCSNFSAYNHFTNPTPLQKEAENEFKALDINLDEPLRDDEKLFAPKPYMRPGQTFNDQNSHQSVSILPRNAKQANGKEAESPKKTKKHKTSR
jgi:hypothetical protein